MNDWQELRSNFLAWLGLALGAGIPVALLWWRLPPERRRLLPPRRRRAVPWDLPEVYAALLAFFFYVPIFNALLQADPVFLSLIYGGQKPGRESVFLWAAALSLPFTVFTILWVMGRVSGTRPYQLGLSGHRWQADLTLGYLVWLFLTLPVLLINFLATRWLVRVPHPFERLAEQGLSPVEWGLIVFLGVVQAPLLEELLFRGVLQPWLSRRPWGGHVGFAGAVAVSFPWWRLANWPKNWPQDAQEQLVVLAPTLFAVAMLPGYLLTSWLVRRGRPSGGKAARRAEEARAVYATALFFAAFHAGAWPSPIPLFVLGLGLGWLALRTQSLIGPMTTHALFNAVASVVLFSSRG